MTHPPTPTRWSHPPTGHTHPLEDLGDVTHPPTPTRWSHPPFKYPLATPTHWKISGMCHTHWSHPPTGHTHPLEDLGDVAHPLVTPTHWSHPPTGHTHPLEDLGDGGVELQIVVLPMHRHQWFQRLVVVEGNEGPLDLLQRTEPLIIIGGVFRVQGSLYTNWEWGGVEV